MKTEINLSDNYRRENIKLLCIFSKYHKDQTFKTITREYILAFLDSFRRPFKMYLLRFFKWLYYPNLEPERRPKPIVVENIPQLKRKEKSVYKPTDLWTFADDLLFLKYCLSKRMKCFHAVAYDTGCRPHAEVLVNGKTGSRHLTSQRASYARKCRRNISVWNWEENGQDHQYNTSVWNL